MLTDSILPVIRSFHPDSQYLIGLDLGIYWRLAEAAEPPARGAIAPDWFYVPNVPRTLGGRVRRSYVLRQELIAPLLALEYVSGNGEEERDRTLRTGKLCIYEQAIRVLYYGIHVSVRPLASLHVHVAASTKRYSGRLV